ncbi:MAG TPA: phosphoglucosamine mutase [Rhodospirillaceae bacterium]|nr:phosphoglucosamine mutase [Rhodospirillaceae bacterium]MAX63090.1 phosphoglucosamine mutase [Rhodospirillaceae bacterium]MBB57937.1 phosphoglucosamine mutase [Rhodospirillaceae bacterium]HAE02776.1 phosphoglucosamine mutase [Rhodospirillaceae bacterium]|tara:strand:+ start:12384 stop:13724 length:1341 start_codon:yes stop_codon:yes gene_type:complete
MTRNYFGTDGIRGTANQAPIEVDTVLRLALAAGAHFRRGGHRHRVVIGKDTRLSGYMLESALVAGFSAMGMDVMLFGPLPTPAVAMLTRSMRADVGVMISASHNPYRDNGIKLFGPDGYKLSDETEMEIERLMDEGVSERAAPEDIGRATRIDDAPGRYIEAVKRTFPEDLSLESLKIVVDCAHGAAYKVAPIVLRELGATVVPIAVAPNGKNINAFCGATDPAAMCEAVSAHGADIGLALDGDADRLIVCDETGHVVDGDQLMALIANSWAKAGRLRGDVVATVMSNLGMERYLADQGIGLVRTKVGDRYVVDAMRNRGCNLGGEQSGHIVMSDYATTGDGLIAALQVLAVAVRDGAPMSQVGKVFTPVPQRLHNVRFSGGSKPLESAAVKKAIALGEAQLNGSGRLVIRPSGTEPVIRVMAEADDPGLIDSVIAHISDAIEAAA